MDLIPAEDVKCFDLIQDRGQIANKVGSRKLYEDCRVHGFELRIKRGDNVKLRLDVLGDRSLTILAIKENIPRESGERFYGDNVSDLINGREYTNIYGLTIISKKQGGTKTEVWIKRAVQQDNEIPGIIDELVITTQLLKYNFEDRHFGTFRITLKKLVLVSNETAINSTDTVIGPLRFYVTGKVSTEVYTSGEELIP